MAAAVHDLLEALSAAGVTIEARNGSLRYRPASAMTPDLLEAVKSCKDELLILLTEPTEAVPTHGTADLSDGPGERPTISDRPSVAARTAPLLIESVPQDHQDCDSHADREWNRFLAVAIPTPDGNGLHDPSESPDWPSGVPGEMWDAFLADCGRLGTRGKL